MVDSAGHEEIARALGRRARHEGRLDFHKAVLVHVLSDRKRRAVPQAEPFLHARAAQVEIAITQPRLLRRLIVRNREGRRLGFVEQEQRARAHFNFTRRNLAIDSLRRPLDDVALDADHELGPDRVGLLVRLGARLAIAHHLRNARVVAQINKDQVAEVTAAVHPAGKKHLLTHVRLAQLTRAMRPPPCPEHVELHKSGG